MKHVSRAMSERKKHLGCIGWTVIVSLFAVSNISAGIFDAWPQKMKITFVGYDPPVGGETLTNFPVLAILSTNIPKFTYTSFSSTNGWDLRFSDSNATTELNYEMEKWATNTDSYVWIQVPTISGSNDYVWAYWGNSSQTNQQTYTTNGATWNSDYKAVYHFDITNNVGDFRDFTANNNTSTNIGTTNVVNGRILGARGFAGLATRIDLPLGFMNSSNGTVTTWICTSNNFASSAPYDGGMIYYGCGDSTAGDGYGTEKELHLDFSTSGNHLEFFIMGFSAQSSPSSYNDNVWHHVAFTWDTISVSNASLYVDGVVVKSSGTSGSQKFAFSQVHKLGRPGFNSRPYIGQLDEVHLSGIARSANWVWTEWMNQRSNNMFNRYEIRPTGTVITVK